MTLFSDGNETKDNTNFLSSIFISTTALYTTETLKTTLTENISTVSSNVNLTPFTTEHSASQMRTGTSPIEQQNTLTTTPYSITPNVTENFTNFSTVVPMSTVNKSTLPSSKPNNISHSDDASSISTQSDIETHSDNSALKLSTTSIDSSGLSTFGITEKTNGNSTLVQSTKMIGQKNKSSVTTYQPTDTTIHHESGKEDILNPFTDKIGKLN
ncbi:unnamed protein product [Mytilus coruscus]|uniref:Uncharacterized protein n=1 Tax=Mytilus coruscus TaxID=42192 RepID=A0A6J8BLS2_MYTCO|nr:unnamed protein product [Mytilus coruscus]